MRPGILAWRSSALSPAGTSKMSTPDFRAPIVFCFAPPIGPTAPSRKISPVAATLWPRSTFVPELLHHLEREGEAGRRAADVARVDRDRERELDVARPAREDADDRHGAVARVGDRLQRHRAEPRSVAHAEADAVAGLRRRRSGRAAPGVVHPVAVDGDDHVAGDELARRPARPGRRRRSARRSPRRRPCSRAASARPRRRSAASAPSRCRSTGALCDSLTPGRLTIATRERTRRRRRRRAWNMSSSSDALRSITSRK